MSWPTWTARTEILERHAQWLWAPLYSGLGLPRLLRREAAAVFLKPTYCAFVSFEPY